jgi:hypothetical protein
VNHAKTILMSAILMALMATFWAAPAHAATPALAIIGTVPEPASLLLSGIALIAIGVALRKKQRKKI